MCLPEDGVVLMFANMLSDKNVFVSNTRRQPKVASKTHPVDKMKVFSPLSYVDICIFTRHVLNLYRFHNHTF